MTNATKPNYLFDFNVIELMTIYTALVNMGNELTKENECPKQVLTIIAQCMEKVSPIIDLRIENGKQFSDITDSLVDVEKLGQEIITNNINENKNETENK